MYNHKAKIMFLLDNKLQHSAAIPNVRRLARSPYLHPYRKKLSRTRKGIRR